MLSRLYSFSQENIKLTILVNQLRNNDGLLQFTLYNQWGPIQDEHFKKYYKIGKEAIKNHSSVITFEIIKGAYSTIYKE